MKTKTQFGSKRFWMLLTVMLTVFIVLIGTIFLVSALAQRRTEAVSYVGTKTQQDIQTQPDTDTDYGDVKTRVDENNNNRGSDVREMFSGEKSTVVKAAEQRMFFSAVKSILFITLLVLLILFVLIKGFKITLFKRRKKPEPAPAAKGDDSKPEDKKDTPTDVPDDEAEEETEVDDTVTDDPAVVAEPAAEDEESVAENCQLP